MSRGARLLLLLRPYTLLFVTTIVATLVASVMDGATFVLLIPFLRALFGYQALPTTGASGVEDVLAKIAGPFLVAGAPPVAPPDPGLPLPGGAGGENVAEDAAAGPGGPRVQGGGGAPRGRPVPPPPPPPPRV